MDLSKMSEIELKSLCYDQLLVLNKAQNNIRIIEGELLKRADEAAPIVKGPKAKESSKSQ